MFSNNTALVKTKFGKHEVLYNFMMLTHYIDKEFQQMAKTPEEVEKQLNTETHTNKCPITRTRARELNA